MFLLGRRSGPGYATPLDAMVKGPREELIYMPCIAPAGKPDYLATVDLNKQQVSAAGPEHDCREDEVGNTNVIDVPITKG